MLSWNIAIQDVIMAEYHITKKKKKHREVSWSVSVVYHLNQIITNYDPLVRVGN